MMHAMGFRHEQARGDRDKYITIQYQNIKTKAVKNFNKGDTLNKMPYDLESVMQYFLRVRDNENMQEVWFMLILDKSRSVIWKIK